MKRNICLIVTVLLLINIIPFAALAANGDTQDNTISFTVSDATVDPGMTDRVVVYVDIAGNPGFAGAELIIKYDNEKLTLLSVKKGTDFPDITPTLNAKTGFVLLDNYENVTGTGTLLTVTFSLNTSENEPAPEGDYEINIDVQSLFDENLVDIASSVKPGKVIVSHDWTAATCTAPKTCKTCGATDGNALDHIEGEAVKENEQPATANAPGSYEKVVYCTVCGTELSRETVTVEKLDSVAKIGETFYDTLKEALYAAKTDDTVTLVTDTTEDILMVPAGVTLDLNGKTITATVAALAYGDIIDTAETVGGIKIDTDKIVHLQPDNGSYIGADNKEYFYLPLYANGCYQFFSCRVTVAVDNASNTAKGELILGYDIKFNRSEAYAILGNGGSNITVRSSLTWVDMDDSELVYVFADNYVKDYGNARISDGNIRLQLKISGLEKIAEKELTINTQIISATGVSATKSKTYTYPQNAYVPE